MNYYVSFKVEVWQANIFPYILLKSANMAALTIELLWTPGNVSIAKNKLCNF